MSGPRRPALVEGVRLVEQVFQGEPGFVVKPPGSGTYLRFRPVEAQVIRMFDGQRTVAEIAAALARQGVEIGAAAIDSFATKLASMGLVQRSVAEQSSAQLERLRQERRQRRRKPLFRGELLRMRFSMGDPDRLLDRTIPFFRWCFTPAFVGGSVIAFALYALLLTSRWEELSSAFAQITNPANWTLATALMFWGSFILVGVVHELGHAYACKGFDGEVNEMGFMIMYFQPAFYCNVNDAWTFPRLSHRLWVTAAGAWVELLFGAAAATTWALVTPGTVLSELALMVTILAGGMALLSNANPLLPYDGYFALTDWLEIPNLRQRALAYFNWYVSVHLLRRDEAEPPATDRERRVFLWYGSLATLYIATVYVFVLRFVVGWTARTFGTGTAVLLAVALALWQRRRLAVWWLAARSGWRDLTRARWQQVQERLPAPIRGWKGGAVSALLCLLLPWPRTVDGFFTARPAGLTTVTAPADGIVTHVHIEGGDTVNAGTPVLRLVNRDVERTATLARLDRDSMQLRTLAGEARRAADVSLLNAQAAAAGARAASLAAAERALVLRATVTGEVLTERPALLTGKQVRAGTVLLHLGMRDSLDVRLRFRGAGATDLHAGQRVRLFLDADGAAPITTVLRQVSLAASPEDPGAVEATVRLGATDSWRAGTTGLARVRLAWSTVGGSLIWGLRSRLRPDLFL